MSFGSFLKHEAKALLAVTLFFFAGFLLILLVLKLLLAGYDIQFNAFAKALFGALVLSKVVVVLRKRGFMQFAGRRGIVRVLCKSAVYMAGVYLVLAVEKIIHAWGEAGGFVAAVKHVTESGNANRMIAVTLLVGSMLVAYNCWEELLRAVGREKLVDAFFRGPSH